jgi:hypothetical protein
MEPNTLRGTMLVFVHIHPPGESAHSILKDEYRQPLISENGIRELAVLAHMAFGPIETGSHPLGRQTVYNRTQRLGPYQSTPLLNAI